MSQPFEKQTLPPIVIGGRHGRVVVSKEAQHPEWVFHPKAKSTRWVEILCDCGTRKVVRALTIAQGGVTSCGCRLKEIRANWKWMHSPALKNARGEKKISNFRIEDRLAADKIGETKGERT
jgi:hypothetical protein